MQPISQKRKPRGPARFPDIMRAAEIAGVTRVHLYRVLTGERPSQSIVRALRKANHPLAEVAARASSRHSRRPA
jgi:hypothetical protein